MPGQVATVLREFRAYPRQFWILVGGIFIYVGGAALGFPYESIYLHRSLHISTTWIGAIFGLVPVAVMPFQIWGGALTDRFGRRWMLILSTVLGAVWFAGFASLPSRLASRTADGDRMRLRLAALPDSQQRDGRRSACRRSLAPRRSASRASR